MGASPGVGSRAVSVDEDVWAIRCIALRREDRHRWGRWFGERLKSTPGLKGNLVRVEHEADVTNVYYGRYRRDIKAARGKQESERIVFRPNIRKDLELIQSLSMTMDGQTVWPFGVATPVELPAPPVGNAAWNLNNIDGYWSLHVGVFYDTETMRGRKKLAAEYCRLLRGQGEPAYFHHGAVRSSVYLGVFPKAAIQEFKREDPYTGAISIVSKIVDAKMLGLQRRFPESLHNGHKAYDIVRDPSSKQVKERRLFRSFPVKLPRAERAELGFDGG
jgi:hypothetical protein